MICFCTINDLNKLFPLDPSWDHFLKRLTNLTNLIFLILHIYMVKISLYLSDSLSTFDFLVFWQIEKKTEKKCETICKMITLYWDEMKDCAHETLQRSIVIYYIFGWRVNQEYPSIYYLSTFNQLHSTVSTQRIHQILLVYSWKMAELTLYSESSLELVTFLKSGRTEDIIVNAICSYVQEFISINEFRNTRTTAHELTRDETYEMLICGSCIDSWNM